MRKRLLIIGAGGHGKVAKEVALSMKINDESVYTTIDFLDDVIEDAVGKIKDLESVGLQYDEIFVAIGDNNLRKCLSEKVENMDKALATLIHCTAYVSPTAVIGEGTIVEARAVVNTHVDVKQGCIISVGAIIDHNAVIESFCHVNTGAICCAGSILKSERKTAAGEIVKGY